MKAWPEVEGKFLDLATRILLNTNVSAFHKLELRQSEVLTGDKAEIQKRRRFWPANLAKVDLERR